MARIAGVSTEKDSKGNITKVTIDVKKHHQTIMPVLKKMGIVEEDAFEKEWAKAKMKGNTVESLRQDLYKTVEALPWKK